MIDYYIDLYKYNISLILKAPLFFKLFIFLFVALILLLAFLKLKGALKYYFYRGRILARGRPAKAKIIDIQYTTNPFRAVLFAVEKVTLEVYDGSKPPYQVSIGIFSTYGGENLHKGMIVPIKIDPNNPKRIAIENT